MFLEMGKNLRFRCPICGHIVMERNLNKNYDMDVFKLVGLGRAKGFRYDPVINIGIIERIKNKIKNLYEKFFADQIKIQIPVTPRYELRPRLDMGSRFDLVPDLNSGRELNLPISINPEVKIVG